MEVLVTGGDTELGRVIADRFHDAGHDVTLMGVDEDALKGAADRLSAKIVVCDNTDPASLTDARGSIPHHIDAIVNVPAPRWTAGDPRTYSMTELAAAWRSIFDAHLLSAVLTVQTVGDHLRSGGSIISVLPENPAEGSAAAAVKAALADWTEGQAGVFGTRGITVNVIASGGAARPGYDGLTGTAPSAPDEIARLALFLTTPSARHITGQTLHVSSGALAHFG
ncbi:MAG TPA: SDR family oxidoreductase [Mycobacterium sp.]|nr:SDR family oxidoreductase [Mycobacterium sp.]